MTDSGPADPQPSHTGKGANWWRLAGPALLFSGAAIGTSHLVQSTRAGAVYGLALVGVILLANLLKFPAFRFGVDYGHATRQSILVGYRDLGRWAPMLFGLAVIPITPIIHAAIAAGTAGVLMAVTGIDLPVPIVGAGLMVLAGGLLLFGGYDWLDKINRVLLAFLVISTLITTVIVLPRVEWGTLTEFTWVMDPVAILFVIALAGFMPNPLEVSVSQSMWTAKVEEQLGPEGGSRLQDARRAFSSSYVMTALMAVCFCIMGAGVMHSSGVPPEGSAPAFAAQVIGLYESALGETAAVFASIAALSVMLTTMLAAMDISSRVIASTCRQASAQPGAINLDTAYRITVPTLVVIGALVLYFFIGDFTALIDVATSFAFVAAPITALLNHLAVTGRTMPIAARPGLPIRALNIIAIVTMTALSIAFFILR